MKQFEQALMDSYPDPYLLFKVNDAGCFLEYANKASTDAFDLQEGLIGRPIEQLFESSAAISQGCNDAIHQGAQVTKKHFSIAKKEVLYESVSFVPIKQGDSNYCGIILYNPYFADKHMTDDQMLENIFRSSPNALLIQHLDGETYRVNPAFTEMFGWKDSEVLGNGVSLFPSGFEKEYEEIVRQLRKHDIYNIPKTKRVHKDGTLKDVSICYINIYNHRRERTAVARLYGDISQQILFKEKYIKKKNSYQLIAENMKDLVSIVDMSGKVAYSSPSHLHVTGFTAESYLNRNVFRFIHPDDRRHVLNQFRQMVTVGKSVQAEFRYLHASLDYIWVEMIGSPLYDQHAPFEKFLIVGRDITARKQADKALQESETKYRLILENTSDFVFTFCQEGNIQYVSPSAKEWMMHKPCDNFYTFMDEYVVGDDRDLLHHMIKHVFQKENPEQLAFTTEKSGRSYTFDAVLTPLISKEYSEYEENMILIIARDITKRLEDEHVSMQLEKMSTVGQLAAGIAHELRNPLTSVAGFLRMIDEGITDPVYKGYIDIITGELNNIERIADEFMDLAKPHVVHLEEADLTDIVDSCVRLFEGTAFLQGINMDVQYLTDTQIILNCQKSALKRVFINIMKNAMEAMGKGDELNIKIGANEHIVKLFFIDSGKGIEKDRLQFIGEPFYSTKEKGIGLGLMMSRKIVREHGGRLIIDSEYKQGTTIEIRLPLVPKRTDEPPKFNENDGITLL
ncbi:PAS domain-containing sensor histidine kinase [Alkalihalobacillus sp. AL-G]|uniref:PAS domain-containing sensor histidine kinase n=1 Tax=Alkalihalobacillus sp. AL-G TaxID=2926399 RepID=UPI00272B9DD9|nr:PAS domain-containing sensor histidine kinase [Alkalihalobacillus sp. AL-G]WLD94268.1 PAS domain S-box protein [Alkalihalobacillus sp. AL-G]